MPGAHPGAVEGEAQALFAQAQALRGLLALGDVQGGADVADQRALRVTVRLGQVIDPPHRAVGTDDAMFQFVGRAARQGGAEGLVQPVPILGMDTLRQHGLVDR